MNESLHESFDKTHVDFAKCLPKFLQSNNVHSCLYFKWYIKHRGGCRWFLSNKLLCKLATRVCFN